METHRVQRMGADPRLKRAVAATPWEDDINESSLHPMPQATRTWAIASDVGKEPTAQTGLACSSFPQQRSSLRRRGARDSPRAPPWKAVRRSSICRV
jgi:hypothetical protein